MLPTVCLCRLHSRPWHEIRRRDLRATTEQCSASIGMGRCSLESICLYSLRVSPPNNRWSDHLKHMRSERHRSFSSALPPSEAGLSQLSATVLLVISVGSGCPGEPGGSMNESTAVVLSVFRLVLGTYWMEVWLSPVLTNVVVRWYHFHWSPLHEIRIRVHREAMEQ